MLASRPSLAAQQTRNSILSRSFSQNAPKVHCSQVSVHATNAKLGDVVTIANAKRGTWVERGKDWIWGDQDGGKPGQLVGSRWLQTCRWMRKWHRVRWPETGITALYRVGADGCYDLKIASEPVEINKPRHKYSLRRGQHGASARKMAVAGADSLSNHHNHQAATYPQFSTLELEHLETAIYGQKEGYEGITREQVLAMQHVMPGRASFGVELELLFPVQAVHSVGDVLQHAGLQGMWRVGGDGSIESRNWAHHTGREVASPPLQGLHGLLQLYRAMEALQVLQPVVNTTTGLHIHIGYGKASAWSLPHLRNLVHNCVMLESALDEVMPPSRRNNRYCMSLQHVRDLAAPACITQNAMAAKTKLQLASSISPDEDKHYKVNLWAIRKHGTVEFRQPAGTTNPAKAVAHVLLYLRLVEASRTKKVRGSSWGDLLWLCGGDGLVRDWLVRRREELRHNNV